jgi:hypothetical protein
VREGALDRRVKVVPESVLVAEAERARRQSERFQADVALRGFSGDPVVVLAWLSFSAGQWRRDHKFGRTTDHQSPLGLPEYPVPSQTAAKQLLQYIPLYETEEVAIRLGVAHPAAAAEFRAAVDTFRAAVNEMLPRIGEATPVAVWSELCDLAENLEYRLSILWGALQPAEGGAINKRDTPESRSIKVEVETLRVTLEDGEAFTLTNNRQATILKAIVQAGGKWVSSADIREHENERIDRIIAALPEEVRTRIESKTGSGYRLLPLA